MNSGFCLFLMEVGYDDYYYYYGYEEFYVLVVDDNFIDCKFVERIFKIFFCKGKLYYFLLVFKILELRLFLKCNN